MELLDDAYSLALEKRNVKGLTDLAELVLSYLLGKPEQAIQLSTEDSNSTLLAILADRTPLLPPRQGAIVQRDAEASADLALASRGRLADSSSDDDDMVEAEIEVDM